MKKLSLFIIGAIAVLGMIGCTPAANTTTVNTNANSNANAAKPVAAAPTVDAMMATEEAANQAWAKSDTAWFQQNLSNKFVMYYSGQRMDKDSAVKMIGASKCDIKSHQLTEPVMTKLTEDTYVVTYKGTFDGSCTMDGKTEKVPSPVRAASIMAREGDKWMAVYHGENPIIDPKAPPAPTSASPKKEDSSGSATNSSSNANSASNSAGNSSTSTAPATPAKSANTDALAKAHLAGWEAFKNKDAAYFNSNLASNFVLVDPLGGAHNNKADVIKAWTETMKCEGVTKVSFTDAHATSISPTVELLTGKGTADGTCDGQKNGDLYQTAVYVKEGETWKLAFMIESM
jgi:ketosteroid isomerase-like protein